MGGRSETAKDGLASEARFKKRTASPGEVKRRKGKKRGVIYAVGAPWVSTWAVGLG